MQELRFVAVSEDGSYAVLAVPGRSGRFILSIDERLRAVAQGQTSRLAQYEIEVESPLRPKEIQARIRAGETAEEIADAAGIPVERVRWFEGPVLAERAYIADQAQAASVRRAGDSGGPGARLGDIVPERLTASGGTPEDGQWDSRKRGDGNWQVTLTFPSGGRLHTAEWVFDPRRRHVMPDDDNAARLSLPESELPPEPVALPGEATVTPLAPRLGAAAGMGGGGGMGGGAGGFAGGGSGVGVRSFRPERSVIPDRSLGGDRSLADRPMSASSVHAPAPSSSPSSTTSTTSSGSAGSSERPGMPERTGLAHSPAATPVLPRPAYHDHTDFRDAAPESPAHRDPAGEQAAPRRAAAAPTADSDGRRGFDASAAEEIVPVTAPPYVFDEPAADDRDRARAAPARQVVFEEPQPGFLDEQLELAPTAAASVTPPTAEARLAAPAPAPASALARPVAPEHAEPAAAQPVDVRQEPVAAPAAPETGQPAAASPAAHSEPVTAPRAEPAAALPTHTTATPAASQAPASAPAAGASAESGALTESPSRVEPAAHLGSAAEPASTASGVAATAATHAPAKPEPAAAARPATVASTERVSAPTATPTAAKAPAVPAAAAAEPEPAAAAKPSPEPEPKPATASADKSESAEDQSTRQRPAAKKNAKARRSSVPSWDEIMLGSSRQRE
jgi:Protein of unknown function (DUF3071)